MYGLCGLFILDTSGPMEKSIDPGLIIYKPLITKKHDMEDENLLFMILDSTLL